MVVLVAPRASHAVISSQWVLVVVVVVVIAAQGIKEVTVSVQTEAVVGSPQSSFSFSSPPPPQSGPEQEPW
jgi:L-cystine uptake protein TcyP (sodium:dicarboxylate symporter family)